uniref:SANT domain-containing protein n=1 Tax=Fusarium oxysporum (strain Fo5176) TaxID=660025 RepID=A0A0D2XA28_FUSOF
MENMPRFGQESELRARDPREAPKEAPRRKRSQPIIRAVRFEVPPKPAPVEQNSESDDDDDMADYFDMEIGKTEAELSKLEKPKLPTQVMARFAALSHGSMVKIIGEGEGLLKMVKKLPEAVNKRVIEKIHDPTPIEQAKKEDVEMADAVDSTDKVDSEPPKELHQEVQAELDPGPEHSIQVKGSEEPVEAAPTPESSAQVGQETTERPVEHAAKAAGEKIDDSSHEEAAPNLDKTPDQSHVEKSDEQRIENPVEKPVEESIGKPAEETEENHAEKPVQKAENEDTEMFVAPELEPKSGDMDIDEPPIETDRVAPESPPSPSNKKAMDVPSIASETAPTESLEPQKTERTPLGACEDSHKEKSDKDKPVDITAKANGVQPTQTLVEKPTEALPEPTPGKPDDAVSEKPAELFTEPRPENLTENAEALGHRQVAIEGAPVSVVCPNVVLQTTETASKPPSTPSQVDDDETESEDDSFMNLDTVRQYMTTPPIDSLPDYSCMPWDKDSAFLKTLDSSITLDDFVVEHLDKMHLEKSAEQDHDRKIYKDNYERYLDFTMSNDPAAVKSRGKFSVSTGIEITGTVTPEPKHEGSGRGRRFATERDLERVLQASMREDEERKERELRMQQEKYRTDKEAIIPNMIWNQEEKDNTKYLDKSGFTPVDRLVSAWRVLPPVNNFTEEEAGLFEKRYLEAPKQWGRVAEAIPHRDFGSCIQYYYMNKKDLNLKEKLKKQPKRRRKGKAKQRSSALVSELGNGDGETEENHDTGENGERRRPRRAAAPTWGFEQPPVDTENSTPNATPGRRGGSAKVDHPEKVDGRKRRRGPKEKEPKAAKANQTLAAAPGPGKGRSRSNSRALNTDGPSTPLPAAESHRLPGQFEQHPAGIQLPFSVQQQQQQQQQPQQQPIQTLERQQSVAPSSISEVMAAPSLRPDPPPQPAMATFNLAHPPSERKAPTQASSYWSVSESNDFPHLLRSFGSDWTGIAAHMGSKTAVMVKNYFVRQKDQGKSS